MFLGLTLACLGRQPVQCAQPVGPDRLSWSAQCHDGRLVEDRNRLIGPIFSFSARGTF
jgi:hypothetical protein